MKFRVPFGTRIARVRLTLISALARVLVGMATMSSQYSGTVCKLALTWHWFYHYDSFEDLIRVLNMVVSCNKVMSFLSRDSRAERSPNGYVHI